MLIALAITVSACTPEPLLSEVSLSLATISPNGDGIDDVTTISYRLSRRSELTIKFIDDGGGEYLFRHRQQRSPGRYRARFAGSYAPEPGGVERRVLPDGNYTYLVVAEDEAGRREEHRGELTIIDADTTPPLVKDVVCLPCTISPNGDARDDESVISYRLTKGALVSLWAVGEGGERYLLEAENEKAAALHSHRWNGTSGGELIPDGGYTIRIEARDKAGNVSVGTTRLVVAGGGRPRLEIVKARFYPLSLPRGGLLNVEIRVKNTGETALRTMGPPPGTAYTTQMTFNSFREGDDPAAPPLYYERAGYWRVGVDWSLSGRLYPVRWGLGRDLAPGEEAVITGTIRVLIDQTREVYFWAGVAQEGVGFPGGPVGQQRIVISY